MTQLFPVLFLGIAPWQRGHLGGIRLSKRSFTCAKLSAHSISSTTYPSKAYKALIFMVFTHPQSLLSSGLSLLTIMHSAWKALNETSSRYYIGNSWLNLTSFYQNEFYLISTSELDLAFSKSTRGRLDHAQWRCVRYAWTQPRSK